MCGICGFLKYRGTTSDEDGFILRNMSQRLIHRGPDAQDILLLDNLALGFTRLSIIGLNNGMQPIYNETQDLVLICNGEIFNYIELRKQLRAKGHAFSTESDVEVIVHLYEEKGIEFLNDLNGQFAFALFDKKKRQMFCARDQMGIIPFFYTCTKDAFIFASEAKAILEHPQVQCGVDLTGLDQVFAFPGLLSPRTMFEGVRSLENGHYLLVSADGQVVDREYWDLPFPGPGGAAAKNEAQYVEELAELFADAVRLRLRSDVPSGFYLSGGLDSSMIAMMVYQLTHQQKRAFSIDFPDAQLSESYYQKLAARQANAELYQKTFYFNDISDLLQKAIYHCECPLKETYNTASLHLSGAVREKDLKVILSGEGADEFFAGYVGYRFDKMRAEALLGTPFVSAREAALRSRIWGDPDFIYEGNLEESAAARRSIYSGPLRDSFEAFNCLNHPIVDPGKLRGRDVLHKRSYLDYKLRLVDHLIADHGDRMAMANSVEVRYPFLDKNLVEYSTTIPGDLKLNEFTEKYILRKIAERSVPRPIVDREKHGFVAPGSPYLLQQNVEYINDLLSYDTIKRQGYFDADQVEALKKQYRRKGFTLNVPFDTDVLIIVITFGILLEQFFHAKASRAGNPAARETPNRNETSIYVHTAEHQGNTEIVQP